MRFVLDANIVIAMLIKPGKPINLFLLEKIELFSPNYLFIELENNKDEIIKKTKYEPNNLHKIIAIIKNKINVIDEKKFIRFRNLAEKICPDPKDIIYFALALYLDCPIWTNEKKLKNQNVVKIFSTHELIRIFRI